MRNSPLYLPKGSVRSILALGLTAAAVFGFMIGRISPEVFMPLVTMAVAFYFGNRSTAEGGK